MKYIITLLFFVFLLAACTSSNEEQNQGSTLPVGQEPNLQVPSSQNDNVVDVGETVSIFYEGSLDNGTIFDATQGVPIELQTGQGNLIPGFEEALIGMTIGETKNITIPVDQAYGPYNPEFIQQVPKETIQATEEIEVGGVLTAVGPDGSQIRALIINVTNDTITVDLNHPLADQDLNFEIELVDIVS